MFDFSSIFTPERMAQGAQGVQAINRMPWVFNGYLPQLMLGQQAAAAPAAAPGPAVPNLSGSDGNIVSPSAQWLSQQSAASGYTPADLSYLASALYPNQSAPTFTPADFGYLQRLMLAGNSGGAGF